MRLTLRTLLAYLDDVLDPADKEALAKKIESSEFAEDLVHRTKDTMRRLRLSAPQVISSGMGLDPNSVAEYLDNTLPPESVGDFERICLESDMHLAEVASCHHVLTMVLGQPAEIDPAAKQRMYTIPAELADRKKLHVDGAHVVAAGQPIAAPAPPPVPIAAALAAEAPRRAQHVEIPEYLRTTGLARYRGLLAGLAAVLLVAATMYYFGGLREWLRGGSGEVAEGRTNDGENTPGPKFTVPPAGADDIPSPAATENAVAAPNVNTTLPGTVEGDPALDVAPPPLEVVQGAPVGEPAAPSDAADTTSSAQPAPPLPQPPTTSVPNSAPVDETVGNAMADDASAANAAPPATGEPSTIEDPIASPAADAAANLTADASTPNVPATAPNMTNPDASAANVNPNSVPDLPAPDAPSDATAMTVDPDGTVRIGAGGPAAVGAADSNVEAVEAPQEPEVVELGTYRGGATVLLRYDDEAGAWLRVAPRSGVVQGEKLLALPEFRPVVMLTNGVHLDLIGGSLVTFDASGAAGSEIPSVDVAYGRVVLINTSNADQQVRLVLGATSADARLAQNATLAVEVERRHVAGSDPAKTPAPLVARLYVPDGGVTWQDASGTTAIDAASQWTVADGVPTAVVASATPPTWIDQQQVAQSSEQRYAAPVIEGSLVSNRPVDVQLLELFQGNGRREVKSLVARSGMHVGLYVPFIEALRDSAQRPNWATHIESLRAAMAMSPESAANIRAALVEQRGDRAAADLYEMLCGYNAEQIGHTPDQVKAGAIARLIDWLGNDSLDYRVLAVHDLWQITGKQLMPNPAGSLSERQRNVARWRSRLEEGDLSPVPSE